MPLLGEGWQGKGQKRQKEDGEKAGFDAGLFAVLTDGAWGEPSAVKRCGLRYFPAALRTGNCVVNCPPSLKLKVTGTLAPGLTDGLVSMHIR